MSSDGTFTERDFWRAIILYGRNTATYKMALGRCIADLVRGGQTRVPIDDLALRFFDLYKSRLVNGKPQLSYRGRLSVMEQVVEQHNRGLLDTDGIIARINAQPFAEVIPRFHTVNSESVLAKFYEIGSDTLTITDEACRLFTGSGDDLLEELGSRWSMLEASFQMHRDDSALVNDIRRFYLERGRERSNISKLAPALQGYQNGICFYCGEAMREDDTHVDHVIPWQLVRHDEVWNLVLAHGFCNEQKSDALPDYYYIEKLIARNEALILSKHPLKKKLLAQLGRTPSIRRRHILKVYEDARIVLRYTWQGIRGYNPATDPFYKSFVRSISK
ncbi:MAG: HNH endonuclease [Bacillota bacterium]|jgi:5-methylcytosine-specific restriction endonuclease McrA